MFAAYVLIEHAQAQPGYVPPPTPLPPPVFNPSSPNVVPQPSYRPLTPSTPSTFQAMKLRRLPFQDVRLRRLRMKGSHVEPLAHTGGHRSTGQDRSIEPVP